MSLSARSARVDQLIDELNPEQRAAVLHRGGPVLVLAGAGTGKTRVISVRIAHLVAQRSLPPEGVLALTFTNKAAGEMAERIAQFLGADAAQAMTIGTFHALGLQMLERDAKRLGFERGVSLLDASDQTHAVRSCLKQLRIDPKRHDPRSFLMTIGNCRNAGITPEELLDTPGRELHGRVYRAYLEWLHAYQAMDFDDLILRSNQLLREHPEVLERWRGRFRAVLVDEYQDTNLAQLELVRLLVDEHRDLCAVGDDDQSIYGWRGADLRNILEFERHFPDATTLALTQNYRSTGHILGAANAVIGHNAARRDKSLWTEAGDGQEVRVVTCKDPSVEAAFVAAEIGRLRRELGLSWAQFGVLFRASTQTTPFEEAFRLTGVPYRLIGAYEFFERKEIKDVLSYLRLAANPHDDATLLRIVNFPQRGIGPKAIERLHDAAKSRGRGLFEAVEHADGISGLNRDQQRRLLELADIVRESGRRAASGRLSALLRWLIDTLGARAAWIRDPGEGPGGERRWRNVETLMTMLEGWQGKNPNGTIRDWLRVVALDAKNVGERSTHEDAVSLLTLHAAKGLEWPVAFVVGCQEGLIPHQRTLESGDGDISEERRLFYVGITRAQRRCYLTWSKVRLRFSGREPSRQSRFLREIPGAHREDVDREKGGGTTSKEDTRARLAALRARLGKG